jgi:hypothetical protein
MFIPFIILGAVLVGVVILVLVSSRKQQEAWNQFAVEIGAEFVKGGFRRSSLVRARVREWTVTLDTYSVPSGDSSTTYTRMRAPFKNTDGFQFLIFRTGLISKIDKALGSQDIEIGDAEFDRRFTIQGNNESKVRSLFSNQSIRQMVQEQRSIRLGVKKDELVFETQGVIKDIERLKSLIELFKETLIQLQG